MKLPKDDDGDELEDVLETEEETPEVREPAKMTMRLPEGEEAYRLSDKAYEEMIRRGIKLPTKPSGFRQGLLDEDGVPIIPSNIMDMSEQHLGELSTVVQLYYSYVLGQAADVKNRYKEAKEQHEFVSSKVRLTKEGTSADKESRKITDRRYVMSRARALELECLHTLISAVEAAWDANWKLISRLVTVREQELKKGIQMAHLDSVRTMRRQIEDRPQREGRVIEVDQDGQHRSLRAAPTRPSRRMLPSKRSQE